MEVKINREIRNYTESMFFGLSLRQFLFAIAACGVAVLMYFCLRPYFGVETLSWMCMLGAAPFAALGFIKYNGMTAEKFVWAYLKSEYIVPKKLTFHSTNIYHEALKETLSKHENMTEKDREYLIGKRYDCERMAHGASDGFRGNRYTELVTDQSGPLLKTEQSMPRLMRVAAYCRVSTDDDEQLNSYEAQIAYYTEAIAKNPSWSFVGIYADEGITGTATCKRKEFLRLMRDCEKGKVDMILTKSISRFARNTVDSLTWVRKLRAMGISVYFEEQALDSLKAENEMLIGLFSVIAQSESENISSNVRWGIRQSMKAGKFASNFSCYGYRRGDDGIPVIVPKQAEIVKDMFSLFLDGYSMDQMQKYLYENNIKTFKGRDLWSRDVIRGVLTNEKYVGDLLLQKSFVVDCISKKTKKNNGELAKYLVSNNHPPIVDRDTFNKVQAEMARRSSKRKKSSRGITEQGKYSGKYALSELLVCGECGSSYRRTSKTKNGKRKYVWRCINRIENGQERCDAIGIDEGKLHDAICRCLSKMFDGKDDAMKLLNSNLAYAISGNESALNSYAIENQIDILNKDMDRCLEMRAATSGDVGRFDEEIKKICEQLVVLRQQLDLARVQMTADEELIYEVNRISELLSAADISFTEYDDVMVRRLVECIRVMKDRRIVVILKGGMQAEEQF